MTSRKHRKVRIDRKSIHLQIKTSWIFHSKKKEKKKTEYKAPATDGGEVIIPGTLRLIFSIVLTKINLHSRTFSVYIFFFLTFSTYLCPITNFPRSVVAFSIPSRGEKMRKKS